MYTQSVIHSMEIEKQIAFDNNNLASFGKKWATFKQCPSDKKFDLYTVQLIKVTNGQMGMEDQKAGSLLFIDLFTDTAAIMN